MWQNQNKVNEHTPIVKTRWVIFDAVLPQKQLVFRANWSYFLRHASYQSNKRFFHPDSICAWKQFWHLSDLLKNNDGSHQWWNLHSCQMQTEIEKSGKMKKNIKNVFFLKFKKQNSLCRIMYKVNIVQTQLHQTKLNIKFFFSINDLWKYFVIVLHIHMYAPCTLQK